MGTSRLAERSIGACRSYLTALPEDVAPELLRADHGMFQLAQARGSADLQWAAPRLIAADLLTRVWHGIYVSAADYHELDAWERHMYGRGLSLPHARLRSSPVGRLPPRGDCRYRVDRLCFRRRRTEDRPERVEGNAIRAHPGRPTCRNATVGGPVRGGWSAEHGRRSRSPERRPCRTPSIVADAAVRSGADLAEAVQGMQRWKGVGQAGWVADQPTRMRRRLGNAGPIHLYRIGLADARLQCMGGDERTEISASTVFGHFTGRHSRVTERSNTTTGRTHRGDCCTKRARVVPAPARSRSCPVHVGIGSSAPSRARGRFQALLRDNPPRSEPIRWWKDVPGVGPVEPAACDWPSPYPVATVLPGRTGRRSVACRSPPRGRDGRQDRARRRERIISAARLP